LLRRIQGVNDIMNYDKKSLEELKTLMDQLNADKEQLNIEKEELEATKTDVEAKKRQVVSLKATAELAQKKYEEQAAELEAQGNQISGSLSELKGMLSSLGLGSILTSSGFTRPTNSGRLSAGTWHYGLNVNGGVHLGMDIAAGVGTPIFAAGNGVVLASADGCSNDGYIGNSCGEAQGGSRGGGNQVYLLTSINNVTYAVKYLHMSPGSPAPTGRVVDAGDQIGTIGKSGNVTGAHVHVEVFKLGTMSLESYASSWSGDLAFGAGWGAAGLNRLCSNVGAPCRVKPETVFGY
ncbi:murein hydrolase activator EnvC family protein, partial [Holdemania massiliensis]